MALSDIASPDLGTALRALRDHLVECLEECPPDKAAPLATRLEAVLVRLDDLTAPEVSKVDQLAAARAKRRTGS